MIALLAQAIVVHVDASSPHTMLQQEWGDTWVDRCLAPCDVAVRSDGRFRISGSGVRSSATFTLPAHDATIDVKDHSQAAWLSGVVLASAGFTLFAGSIPLDIFGAAVGSCSQFSCTNGTPLVAIPIAIGALSLAAGIVGIVFVANNGPSRVRIR